MTYVINLIFKNGKIPRVKTSIVTAVYKSDDKTNITVNRQISSKYRFIGFLKNLLYCLLTSSHI